MAEGTSSETCYNEGFKDFNLVTLILRLRPMSYCKKILKLMYTYTYNLCAL